MKWGMMKTNKIGTGTYMPPDNALPPPPPANQTGKITRVEIIDETGRVYVNNDVESCQLMFQDDNRTLKIFLKNK